MKAISNTCSYSINYLGNDYRCEIPKHSNYDHCVIHEPNIRPNAEVVIDALKNYISICNKDKDVTSYNFRGGNFPELDFTSFVFEKDCHFNSSKFLGRANFEKALFKSNAEFGHSTFLGDAYFIRTQFNGMASFSSCEFKMQGAFSESRFNKDTYFNHSRFHGHFNIGKSSFKEDTGFCEVVFYTHAYITSCVFFDDVNFMNCIFHDDTSFWGSNFHSGANFEDTKFFLRVNFRKTIFNGEIEFRNSYINKAKDVHANGFNFEGAVLNEITFWHVNQLIDFSFRNSMLLSISFADRELINCDLTGAVIDSVRTRGWKPDDATLTNTKFIYTDFIGNIIDGFVPVSDSRVPIEGNFGEGENSGFTIKDFLIDKYVWSSSLKINRIVQAPLLQYIKFFEEFSSVTEGIDVEIKTKKEGKNIRVEFFTKSIEEKDKIQIAFQKYLAKLRLTDDEVDNLTAIFDFKSPEPDVMITLSRLQEQIRSFKRDLQQTQKLTDSDEVKRVVNLLLNDMDRVEVLSISSQTKNIEKIGGLILDNPSYDVGIITVINTEKQALLKVLECNNNSDRIRDRGSVFWKTTIKSHVTQSDLNVIIHCISKPGNHPASAATTKVIERFNPKAMFLMGISAGIRGKIKIGDVVIPRIIVDDTLKAIESGEFKPRTSNIGLHHSIQQMLGSFDIDIKLWHELFNKIFESTITPPKGKKNEYKNNVTFTPGFSEAAIYSSDILLKDPNHLNVAQATKHQQIKIGEMEAGGFIEACKSRGFETPWFIVRGVSDFGDDLKDDVFHELASCSAASFLANFLINGFDLGLLDSIHQDTLKVNP